MTRRMDDGRIIDTAKATERWEPAVDWDGRNQIDRNTGDQWLDQRLYRSAKGNYYTVTTSRRDDVGDTAEWLTPAQAAAWLVLNDEGLPDDLAHLATEVSE